MDPVSADHGQIDLIATGDDGKAAIFRSGTVKKIVDAGSTGVNELLRFVVGAVHAHDAITDDSKSRGAGEPAGRMISNTKVGSFVIAMIVVDSLITVALETAASIHLGVGAAADSHVVAPLGCTHAVWNFAGNGKVVGEVV